MCVCSIPFHSNPSASPTRYERAFYDSICLHTSMEYWRCDDEISVLTDTQYPCRTFLPLLLKGLYNPLRTEGGLFLGGDVVTARRCCCCFRCCSLTLGGVNRRGLRRACRPPVADDVRFVGGVTGAGVGAAIKRPIKLLLKLRRFKIHFGGGGKLLVYAIFTCCSRGFCLLSAIFFLADAAAVAVVSACRPFKELLSTIECFFLAVGDIADWRFVA